MNSKSNLNGWIEAIDRPPVLKLGTITLSNHTTVGRFDDLGGQNSFFRLSRNLAKPRVLVAECLYFRDPNEFWQKKSEVSINYDRKESVCEVGLKEFQSFL